MNQYEDKIAANIQQIETEENNAQQDGQVQYEDQEQTKIVSISEEEYQPLENYIISKTLGKGNFGKVKLATHKLTGQLVAVKILQKQLIFEKSDIVRISRQLKIMKIIRHPFVIQLYEIIETPKQLYLIMEYAQNGDLFDKIVKLQKLKEGLAAQMYAQIALGLQYLHDMGVSHRDLKPQNILIDKNNVVKIADFGLGNMFKIGQKLKTACGSPCYASPQMLNKEQYDPKKIDIWSSGIILYAMVCGYLPFQDKVTSKLYQKIKNSSYKLPSWVSNPCRNLIRGILTKDPSLRWDIQVILQHEFLALQVNKLKETVQKKEINQQKLKQVCQKYGIQQRDRLINSLRKNKHSNLTTLYYLGLKSIQKQKLNPKKEAIFKQFQQILDIQQQSLQTNQFKKDQLQEKKQQLKQEFQNQIIQKQLSSRLQSKQNIKMQIQESVTGKNRQQIGQNSQKFTVTDDCFRNTNNASEQNKQKIDNEIMNQSNQNRSNQQATQLNFYQQNIQTQNQVKFNNKKVSNLSKIQESYEQSQQIKSEESQRIQPFQQFNIQHSQCLKTQNIQSGQQESLFSQVKNQRQTLIFQKKLNQDSTQIFQDQIQLKKNLRQNYQREKIQNLIQEQQNDFNTFPQNQQSEQIMENEPKSNSLIKQLPSQNLFQQFKQKKFSNIQKEIQVTNKKRQIKQNKSISSENPKSDSRNKQKIIQTKAHKEQGFKNSNKSITQKINNQVATKACPANKNQIKKVQILEKIEQNKIHSSHRLKKSERIKQYKPLSRQQDLSDIKLYERSHSKDRPIVIKSKMNQKYEIFKSTNQEKVSKTNNKSLNESYSSISPSSTPKYKREQIQKFNYGNKLSYISETDPTKKLMISGKQMQNEPYLINPQRLILCQYEDLCKILDYNGFIGKFQYFSYKSQYLYMAKSNLKLSTKAIQMGKKITLQKLIEQINNQRNFLG